MAYKSCTTIKIKDGSKIRLTADRADNNAIFVEGTILTVVRFIDRYVVLCKDEFGNPFRLHRKLDEFELQEG